ncbi:alpha/beta hydrolase family protein [Streptomonospora sp. S1-112]|uniref:Alpha/beta hydrolase family protein n=1 Tax=Streptomonospora mangrovi TaxID=2883123 RepID=A0A9X3SKJ9_9ACTN|nr:alpha/beta hydrolase [Streptomonospora mangrovi]MDA0562976.1 alpha/beta hydrolase family protein [Streptomonospora mangrovi]
MTRRTAWARPLLGALLAFAVLGCCGAAGAAGGAAPAPLSYRAAPVGGLLAEDPAGSGRVVAVIGELREAEDVAVVVPGSGQNRENFRGVHNGAGTARRPGTVPMADGQALYAAMRERSPHGRVAVVVWLGYLPPQEVDAELAGIARARHGARELARFAREVLAEDRHTTLVCHSYGTAVCGLAARSPGVADDVVALASPGMGVARAEEIRARVWATRARGDWIRFVPSVRLGPVGLGGDPMAPGFGARIFSAGDITGHTDYYQPGSASLAVTAGIAAGSAPAAGGIAGGRALLEVE